MGEEDMRMAGGQDRQPTPGSPARQTVRPLETRFSPSSHAGRNPNGTAYSPILSAIHSPNTKAPPMTNSPVRLATTAG